MRRAVLCLTVCAVAIVGGLPQAIAPSFAMEITAALDSRQGQSGSPSQPPQPAQDEFVPADQLPPDAELPAARMLIAAYMFVWVAFLVYMFSLLRRVKKVELDLAALERDRERR
jgi:CcmD family protein